MQGFARLSARIIGCQDLRSLARTVVEGLRTDMGFERTALFLVKEDGLMTGTFGTDLLGRTYDEGVSRIPPPSPDDLAHAIDEGFAVFEGMGGRRYSVTPVWHGENVIAIIYNDHTISQREFDLESQRALAMMASVVGAAVVRLNTLEGASALLAENIRLTNRFNTMFAASPVGYLVSDRHFIITDFNEAAARMFRKEPKDFIGKHPFSCFLAPGEDPFWFLERWAKIMHGIPVPPLVASVDMLDFPMVIESMETVLFDEHGEFDGCIAVLINVTAREIEAQTLLERQETLEQRVQQRTKELSSANEQLRQEAIERARTQEQLRASHDDLRIFSQSISHDLRSPIRAISSYVYEFSSDESLAKDARYAENIAGLKRSVKRLTAMLEELTNLARLDRKVPAMEPIRVSDVVQNVVASLPGELNSKNVSLHGDLTCEVLGNPNLLGILVQNLLVNSTKFADPSRPCEIQVSIQEDDDWVVVKFSDNGLGFAPNEAIKIFDPFERLRPGSTPGMGMGLAIVKRIVGLHGGSITAEGELGVGATFIVRLPRVQTQNPASTE
ncbi:MAG: GAF domain-containing sensor histidine kinase [Fimbriimonas sp.]